MKTFNCYISGFVFPKNLTFSKYINNIKKSRSPRVRLVSFQFVYYFLFYPDPSP